MIEIRDAERVIQIVRGQTLGPPADRKWVWYAPGDATRYHVQFISSMPYEDPRGWDLPYEALLVQTGVGAPVSTVRSLLIPKPHEYNLYDEARWLDDFEKFPGWWAGVRPLLAALGWSRNTDTEFDSGDPSRIYQVSQGLRM